MSDDDLQAPRRGSRWYSSPTTFGPTVKVSATAGMVFWVLNLLRHGVLIDEFFYLIAGLPVIAVVLRDLWKRG